jgi:hypothetical protein
MMVVAVGFIVLGFFLLGLFFFLLGYDIGVKDTERRWSDAVNRSQASQKEYKP